MSHFQDFDFEVTLIFLRSLNDDIQLVICNVMSFFPDVCNARPSVFNSVAGCCVPHNRV